jgi:predicted nuclease of predicted toxin-antitoxin system
MKFKIDENLPAEIATDLKAAGHDAETVFDEGHAGSADLVITAVAQREGRVLLTMDKGIADVRAYPPEDYAGIVLFRPASQGRGTTLAFVQRHLPALLASPLEGHLVVVSESSIRVR